MPSRKKNSTSSKKVASPFDGPLQGPGYEVRIQPGETVIDEVCVDQAQVHLEQISSGSWWLGLTLPDGKQIHINLFTKRKASMYTNGWIEGQLIP